MPKPTPTQEENDAAALGAHVLSKDSDGSPLDEGAQPPVETVEEATSEPKRKQMEAKPASAGAGYTTRQATAGAGGGQATSRSKPPATEE
jgi:hypothetical protein